MYIHNSINHRGLCYVRCLCVGHVCLTVATRNCTLPSSCIPLPNLIRRYCDMSRWSAHKECVGLLRIFITWKSLSVIIHSSPSHYACAHSDNQTWCLFDLVLFEWPPQTFPPKNICTHCHCTCFSAVAIFNAWRGEGTNLIGAGDPETVKDREEQEGRDDWVEALPDAHVNELQAMAVGLGWHT